MSRRQATVYLLMILAMLSLLRIRIAGVPFERDEGAYAYIAQHWLGGEVPYRDIRANKGPGSFAIYALALLIAPGSVETIHWMAHAWLCMALVVIFLIGRRLFSAEVGLAAVLAGGLMAMDPKLLGNSANTEVFALLPIAAAMWVALSAGNRRSTLTALGAGLLSAVALLIRQQAATDLALVFAILLIGRLSVREDRTSRQALSALAKETTGFLCGLMLVLLPVLAYFHYQGALGDLYECVIAYNVSYGSRTPWSAYPIVFWQQLAPKLPGLWPFLLLVLWALLRAEGRGEKGWRICAAWLVTSMVAVSAGGYFREHYFIQAVLPASLLAALGANLLARDLTSRLTTRFAVFLMMLSFASANAILEHRWYYFGSSAERICRRIYGANPFPEARLAGEYMRKATQPKEAIYIFGSEPEILFHSGRRSASRFIESYHQAGNYPDSDQRQTEVMEEIRLVQPRFVVIVLVSTSFMRWPPTVPQLAREVQVLLRADYEVAALTQRQADGSVSWVEDSRVRDEWQHRPIWYDRQEGEVTLVLWKRRQ